MKRRHSLLIVATVLAPSPAWAGMPAPYTLTYLAGLRLVSISFFLLVLFLSAVAIRWIWNSLRPAFTSLPKLSYWRSVGLVVLWGLLFTIIMTMISGARELLTPGAWEHHGATYRLKEVGK